NFEEEKSNGVGISIDPIYETDETFYLNTQVGESLITNPDPNSVPEEILLYEDPDLGAGYLVLRLSNLVEPGELVMDQIYLDQMRDYLSVIHDEFATLYDVEGVEGFGMDIEYKVTAQDQLVIKQARPWVSFWAGIKADNDLAVTEIVDPQSSSSLGSNELVTTKIANTGLNDMSDFDISLVVDGTLMETINITETIEPFSDAEFQFTVPQDFSAVGDYLITSIVSDPDDEYINNDTLHFVLSHVHLLDGAISIGNVDAICNGNVELDAIITNDGEETITDVEIEVVVNGMVVETLEESVSVLFQEQGVVSILIDENLVENDNEIVLNLISVNNETDEDTSNNTASTNTDLDSEFDVITFYILADNYPQESSWEIYDIGADELVSAGSLSGGTDDYTEEICVDYNSCFTLYFYDSFGDGICCGFGDGYFEVLNSSGETVVFNNGDFGHEAEESFCLSEGACEIDAEINVGNTSSNFASDGSITIYTNSNGNSFEYSINGGESFGDSNTFNNLSPGDYDVMISASNGLCTYEETVSIAACEFTTVDIEFTNATSAITTDGSIVITPVSGVSPFQYSIDGGQNFSFINSFEGLPIGDYNIVVLDDLGVCEYEIGVPIEALGGVNIENENPLAELINLYPNPTSDQINIEIQTSNTLNEAINIVV
ncbi:MAG: CARDB domain-containing protein, partial [Flavobacteriales bacterium]